MKRYWQILNPDTRECYLSQPMAEAPENSVEFKEGVNNLFRKPVFDVYPSPTQVIEGITQQEIDAQIIERTNGVREDYARRMRELTANAQFELSAFGTPIPQEIQDGYLALKDEMEAAVLAVENEYQQAKKKSRK